MGGMANVTEGQTPKQPKRSSLMTKLVVAVPVIVAVVALAMSNAFASEMMTEDEMDMGGAVEAKWDYVEEEQSVDMDSDDN